MPVVVAVVSAVCWKRKSKGPSELRAVVLWDSLLGD